MFNCPKCWNSPCSCGWEYRDDTKKTRIEMAAAILGVPEKTLADRIGDLVPESHPMKKEEKNGTHA